MQCIFVGDVYFMLKKYRHPTFRNLVQGVGPMSKPRLNDYFVVKLKKNWLEVCFSVN